MIEKKKNTKTKAFNNIQFKIIVVFVFNCKFHSLAHEHTCTHTHTYAFTLCVFSLPTVRVRVHMKINVQQNQENMKTSTGNSIKSLPFLFFRLAVDMVWLL